MVFYNCLIIAVGIFRIIKVPQVFYLIQDVEFAWLTSHILPPMMKWSACFYAMMSYRIAPLTHPIRYLATTSWPKLANRALCANLVHHFLAPFLLDHRCSSRMSDLLSHRLASNWVWFRICLLIINDLKPRDKGYRVEVHVEIMLHLRLLLGDKVFFFICFAGELGRFTGHKILHSVSEIKLFNYKLNI